MSSLLFFLSDGAPAAQHVALFGFIYNLLWNIHIWEGLFWTQTCGKVIGIISALSHNNYLIFLVTDCLWVLKHKHHNWLRNVLCWHSPKHQRRANQPESVIIYLFTFTGLNSSFSTSVLPLKLLAVSWFLFSLSHFPLCSSETASRWSAPEVSSFWKLLRSCHSQEGEAGLKNGCKAERVFPFTGT